MVVFGNVFGTPPEMYNAMLVLCSNHFDQSDFSNFSTYSSKPVNQLTGSK